MSPKTGRLRQTMTIRACAVCGNGVLARLLALHLLRCEAARPSAWRLFWQARGQIVGHTDLWCCRGRATLPALAPQLDQADVHLDRLSAGVAGLIGSPDMCSATVTMSSRGGIATRLHVRNSVVWRDRAGRMCFRADAAPRDAW